MSSTKALPGPYCGQAIALPLSQYFPTRRHSIFCPRCSGRSLLPLGTVAIGVVALLAWTFFLVLLAKGAGIGRPAGFAALGRDAVLFLLGAWITSRMACLVTRSVATRLERHPRSR